jgi:hypothetical protein
VTRGLVLVLALAAAVVCGCGREEETAGGGAPAAVASPYSTEVHGLGTRPRVRVPSSVARRLDAGSVGIVDFVAQASIAPDALWVNQEQKLEDVRWTGWGTERATGRARVRSLECDPNCARGRIELLEGTLELSDVRLCGSRRYYSRARLVTTDPGTGQTSRPATYLRTPC